MLKSRLSRNVAVTGLLVLFTFAGVISAQSPADNELLKMIPEKSLFCVRINNFDFTLNQIDQFLAGVSPIPMGVSMLVRMQLANTLGSPQLTGLNTNGSFAVFGVTMPGETAQDNAIPNVFVGILVPVTDYKQFIDGNTNCSEGDEKGLSKITINGTPIALSAQAGNYALLCWANDYDKLVTMAKTISAKSAAGISSVLDATEMKQAQTEAIWAYGNIQEVSDAFGPIISAKIEEIKTVMNAVGATQPGASAANVQNVMNTYAGILETLMKEAKSLSITINPKPDVLNITKTISAVPGTDTAKMLTQDPSSQRENTLLGYLEDGAVVNFGATMNSSFWKTLNSKSIDFFAAMGGENMSEKNIAEIKTLVSDVISCLEGPVVYSVMNDAGNKPPLALKYLIAVKDENKFNQIIEKSTETMKTSGILDFYKSMGIETDFSMEKAVDSYKGVPINSAKFTMKVTDTNSPQAQMINSMYGEGFNYRWGMVNGICAFALSSDVDSTIHKLIDEVKANSPKPGQGSQGQIGTEMKAALSLLPQAKNADFLLTFNVLRFFNMVTSMMPLPIPPMEAQTKSNIVIAGSAADGKMVVNIAVPKQHLTEIMAAFMAMQQKSAQQQSGTMNQ